MNKFDLKGTPPTNNKIFFFFFTFQPTQSIEAHNIIYGGEPF